jgi:ribonuclease HII
MPQTQDAPERFLYERELAARGIRRIAGVDEAGRGPLAGPVFAAAVVFPAEWIAGGLPEPLAQINDSKQLRQSQREALYCQITSRPEIGWAVAQVDAAEIDRINILQATHRAMNLALAQLKPPPEHVLVDGLAVKTIPFANTAIVKGDALSFSIAAASILAKVCRDRLMVELDSRYPGYGFAEHKGYGTPAHLAAIQKLGPCAIHRRSFAPVRAAQGELF